MPWGEEEMKAQTNEAKRAEAAIYFFVESVHTLESNGWKRDESGSQPWYWWRNPEVAEGMCTLGAALRYEHTRQNRIRPLTLVGDAAEVNTR